MHFCAPPTAIHDLKCSKAIFSLAVSCKSEGRLKAGITRHKPTDAYWKMIRPLRMPGEVTL